MAAVNDLTVYVGAEGRNLQPRMLRLSPTSVKITWTPASPAFAYNGAVVVASPVDLNASNFPTNGVRYTASADWVAPADQLGLAKVVAAVYDDLLTHEVIITNLVPDAPVYAAVHLATNVYGYFIEGSRCYPGDNTSSAYAGKIDDDSEPPLNPVPGQTYYNTEQKLVYTWSGISWLPVTAHTVITGEEDPVAPFIGLPAGYPLLGSFFYNTKQKMLKSWSGALWMDSESKKGEPTYAKIGVGDTGEPGPRETIKGIIKAQLGWPVVCVELTEDQFDISLNNALQELRRRTDSAYYKQYFFMNLFKDQDVYYLNDPTRGLDGIVDVVKIHRMNLMGLQTYGANSIYAQQFLTQFYSPGQGFDLVAIHLMASMNEAYNLIFAGEVAFNWREATRELRLYRRTNVAEKVLIECSMEKSEQELLVDRWTQQWIQQWAEAECMFILARIRGKFSSLPGPGGGLSLNADSLQAEGTRLQEDCLRQIKDFEVGQNGPDNWFSGIVVG